MRLYRLFGITMASRYPFANRLTDGSGTPDLTFTCARRRGSSPDWIGAEPVYVSQSKTSEGESLITLSRLKNCDVVHFARTADFFLRPGTIVAHLLDPSYASLVEIRLLGEIFSIWLELHGVLAIHASSVVVNKGAVGFLSTHGGGKSSLAAALMQAGYPLLSDDILPIGFRDGTFLGRPGYPQMRMWPDQAEYFLGRYEDLEIVNPWYSKRRVPVGQGGLGTFCPKEQPLKVLYIPVRRDPDEKIVIEPLSPKDAFFELIRNSFSARIIEALGLQAQRMDSLTCIVRQVPVRRLVYPSGFEHLPEVRKALIDDMGTL
jgi:hypothetical protein